MLKSALGGRGGAEMSETLLRLIFPLAVGFLSAVSAIYIAALRNRVELQKAIVDLEQSYSKSLFERRLEVYPALYHLLSKFDKAIQYGERDVHFLVQTRACLDDWDSENAIFLGPLSIKISYKFRDLLDTLCSRDPMEVSEKEWLTVRESAIHFENSLRAEIGARSLETVSNLENFNDVYTYLDAAIRSAGGDPKRHALDLKT